MFIATKNIAAMPILQANSKPDPRSRKSFFSRAKQAIIDSDTQALDLLISQDLSSAGAGGEPASNDYHRLLRIAVANDCLPCVKSLAPFCDLSALEQSGLTILHRAAQLHRPDCFLHLEPLVNSEVVASCDFSLLMIAALSGSAEMTRLLASPQEALRVSTSRGFSALRLAIIGGAAPCFDILLPLSDPSAMALFDDGRNCLMEAAAHGRQGFVRRLLPLCDPNAPNRDGLNALMLACEAFAPDCVEVLLPASDPLARDLRGRSALQVAQQADIAKAADNASGVCEPSEEARALICALLSSWTEALSLTESIPLPTSSAAIGPARL